MPKRLVAVVTALLIILTTTGILTAFAEDKETLCADNAQDNAQIEDALTNCNEVASRVEVVDSNAQDVFTIASIAPFQDEYNMGTDFEDTDAYWLMGLKMFPMSVIRPGNTFASNINVPILSWELSSFSPNVPGVYTVYGEINYSAFSSGTLVNPNNLRPAIIITVMGSQVPVAPVIDEKGIWRSSRVEHGVRHWVDTLNFPVVGLMIHLGWDIAVLQSDDEGDTWFDITSSGRLMLATDGFSVSGLEEDHDYGFKIEVNGDGILQGISEPVFVT
jgi:hypothetical protein